MERPKINDFRDRSKNPYYIDCHLYSSKQDQYIDQLEKENKTLKEELAISRGKNYQKLEELGG